MGQDAGVEVVDAKKGAKPGDGGLAGAQWLNRGWTWMSIYIYIYHIINDKSGEDNLMFLFFVYRTFSRA